MWETDFSVRPLDPFYMYFICTSVLSLPCHIRNIEKLTQFYFSSFSSVISMMYQNGHMILLHFYRSKKCIYTDAKDDHCLWDASLASSGVLTAVHIMLATLGDTLRRGWHKTPKSPFTDLCPILGPVALCSCQRFYFPCSLARIWNNWAQSKLMIAQQMQYGGRLFTFTAMW